MNESLRRYENSKNYVMAMMQNLNSLFNRTTPGANDCQPFTALSMVIKSKHLHLSSGVKSLTLVPDRSTRRSHSHFLRPLILSSLTQPRKSTHSSNRHSSKFMTQSNRGQFTKWTRFKAVNLFEIRKCNLYGKIAT